MLYVCDRFMSQIANMNIHQSGIDMLPVCYIL